jgi:hypothetical protein
MERHPDWVYRPSQRENEFRDVSLSSGISVDFFHVGVNRETGEYDSEDYFFVAAARGAGFEAFMLPWITTTHTGSYDFHCNVPAFVKLKEAA